LISREALILEGAKFSKLAGISINSRRLGNPFIHGGLGGHLLALSFSGFFHPTCGTLLFETFRVFLPFTGTHFFRFSQVFSSHNFSLGVNRVWGHFQRGNRVHPAFLKTPGFFSKGVLFFPPKKGPVL